MIQVLRVGGDWDCQVSEKKFKFLSIRSYPRPTPLNDENLKTKFLKQNWIDITNKFWQSMWPGQKRIVFYLKDTNN